MLLSSYCQDGRNMIFCVLARGRMSWLSVISHGTKRILKWEQFGSQRAEKYSIDISLRRLTDAKRSPATDEDDDVACERRRIYEGGSKSDILRIQDLTKVISRRFSCDLMLQVWIKTKSSGVQFFCFCSFRRLTWAGRGRLLTGFVWVCPLEKWACCFCFLTF